MAVNTQTFNVSMPKALVKQIDVLASKQGNTRSGILRLAAIEYLKTHHDDIDLSKDKK